MDVRLFGAVVWRFKWLVLGGILLGGALALLAYRGQTKSETWQSRAELIITQASFPYGRASQQLGGSTKTGAPQAPVGSQSYMSNLAPVYAAIANGSELQTRIHDVARVPGVVSATEVIDQATSTDLPFVQLTATARSGADAVALATAASSVLTSYVRDRQDAAGIARGDRVVLSPIQSGRSPQLTSGHKLTTPLSIFVGVLAAAIALSFILENTRPRTAAALGRAPRSVAETAESQAAAVNEDPGRSDTALNRTRRSWAPQLRPRPLSPDPDSDV
jgi:hypothetical protein